MKKISLLVMALFITACAHHDHDHDHGHGDHAKSFASKDWKGELKIVKSKREHVSKVLSQYISHLDEYEQAVTDYIRQNKSLSKKLESKKLSSLELKKTKLELSRIKEEIGDKAHHFEEDFHELEEKIEEIEEELKEIESHEGH